ncbi:MAG: DUF1573 domain-containing protein [Mariniblastus sp.]
MNTVKLKSTLVIFLLCLFGSAGVSHAQQWARAMFTEYVKDFGKVPLGEVPEYRFEIENKYEEDIRIRSIRSSCGCTIATASKNVLKTWEKGEIICKFNTPAVGPGFKQATVTVEFDRPFVGECQLTVRGTIVAGVSFSPKSIDFGDVTAKKLPVKKITLTSTGNPFFRVADIKSTFQHIKVQVSETARSNGLVKVEMVTQLKDSAPTGFNQGELYVMVEDDYRRRGPNNTPILRQIPLRFSGNHVSEFRVAPEILSLGPIEPGKSVVQKVFLSSSLPFRLTDVKCQSEAFRVKADDANESKKVHIVEVTYTCENKPGRHECELSFYTDLSRDASGKMKAIVDISKPSEPEIQTSAVENTTKTREFE